MGLFFSYDLVGNVYIDLINFTGTSGVYYGANPTDSLTLSGGVFYGMTPVTGNLTGDGVIFSYSMTI